MNIGSWIKDICRGISGCEDEIELLRKERDAFKASEQRFAMALKDVFITTRKLQEDYALVVKVHTPPSPPTIKHTISRKEVYDLYAEIFPDQKDKIFMSDSEYEITSIAEIRRFVEWSKVDKIEYGGFIDCDDFALALAGEFARYDGWSGFPVAIIWGDIYGGHAINTCVAYESEEDKTPRAYYIEPQTDGELVAEMVESMALWLLPI